MIYKADTRIEGIIESLKIIIADLRHRAKTAKTETEKWEMKHIGGMRAGVSKTRGMKNLAEVETRQKWAAGATKISNATVKGKIVEYLWHLKKMGYEPSTVKSYVGIIKTLCEKQVDLFEPENVKLFIAQQKGWGTGRRANVIKAYTAFLRMLGLKWEKPRCNVKKGLPRPPTTEQVKQLIAAATRKYAPIFRFMAETGPSPKEVSIMSEKNFDFERNLVYIEGRKGHSDRIVPISNELAALMRTYLAKYKSFPSNERIGRKFRDIRNKLRQS